MRSAANATTKSPKMAMKAAIATRFFRNCRETIRQYPSGRSSSFICDPRIDKRVQQIRNENAGQCQQSAEREDAHEEWIIAAEHGFIAKLAHTGNGEERFDDDASSDQCRQNVGHERDDGNNRISQSMPEDNDAFIETFRARRANEVLTDRLEPTCPQIT